MLRGIYILFFLATIFGSTAFQAFFSGSFSKGLLLMLPASGCFLLAIRSLETVNPMEDPEGIEDTAFLTTRISGVFPPIQPNTPLLLEYRPDTKRYFLSVSKHTPLGLLPRRASAELHQWAAAGVAFSAKAWRVTKNQTTGKTHILVKIYHDKPGGAYENRTNGKRNQLDR